MTDTLLPGKRGTYSCSTRGFLIIFNLLTSEIFESWQFF